MNYREYGKENKEVMIFLHGGGLSWWNYREVAQCLQSNYHIILPILDGHAESDHSFSTISANAKEIIKFIDDQFNGSVLLIGGLSLGGQILLEILSQRKDICKYAIVESALVIPSNLTYSLIKPSIKASYGLIKYQWFSKLQFKSLKIKPNLFEDYYRDSCAISKHDMIAFLEENSLFSLKDSIKDSHAKVYIYVGEKENRQMFKSARIINHQLSNSYLKVLPNLYHGEFSINHALEYVNNIYEILK